MYDTQYAYFADGSNMQVIKTRPLAEKTGNLSRSAPPAEMRALCKEAAFQEALRSLGAHSRFLAAYCRPSVACLTHVNRTGSRLSRVESSRLTLNPTSPYLTSWDEQLTPLGLCKVEPRTPLLQELRSMYVPQDVWETFRGAKRELPFPSTVVDRQNTIYAAGYRVRMSLIGDPKMRRPEIERLTDLDEAWAVCFRKPKPGWRLLGRFVSQSVFVGLALHDRREMPTRKDYTEKAQAMIDAWSARFPRLAILRAQDLSSYVAGPYEDVYGPSPF